MADEILKGIKNDAVAALVALGYSSTDALNTVNAVEIKEDFNVEDVLKANLYQAPIITEPKYTSAECAQIFYNARAMVIGDSTAEGLVAYGALYDTNVTWTRGRTIQYMTADLEKAINYQPNHLFLSYGANDLLSWCGNVEGYIGAYEKSISYIKSVLPNTKLYKVANSNEIKLDKASILTVIQDDKIEEFDIKILKINNNNNITKNILFEVTDEKLLNSSGGIVQGMSGSPIIQNNKIIGAITHVVVEDPTKGYGIFITNMLEEAEN